MEVLKEIRENFLVCPLCSQKYNNPKLLPCLHSFCRECLANAMQKTIGQNLQPEINGITTEAEEDMVNKDRGRNFECPVCRANIQLNIPAGNNNISQWSDLFADNYFMQNLIENMDMHLTEKSCESCSREGVNDTSAVAVCWCQTCRIAFCESCIKAHNVITACREHVVLSLKDMRSNPVDCLRETKKEIPCLYHRDKVIEYYCVDCHVTVCSSCVAVQHRRCEMVETIKDTVQKLEPEADYVTNDLTKQSEILREWEQDHVKELSELSSNKDILMKEMAAMRARVNEVLLNLENKLANDLDEKHKQKLQEVNEHLRDVEDMKRNVENTKVFVENLRQFGSDSEMVSVFDTIKVKVDDLRATIQKAKLNKLNTRYKLAIDPCIQRLLEMQSLGKIVDMVDLNRDNFLLSNGYGVKDNHMAERKASVKRTGTFRVDKPVPPPSGNMSGSSPSSTSSESLGSQEMVPTRPRRNRPLKPSLRESMGLESSRSSLEPQAAKPAQQKAGTLPRTPRNSQRPPQNVTRTRSSNGIEIIPQDSKNKVTNIRATQSRVRDILSPPIRKREPPRPASRPPTKPERVTSPVMEEELDDTKPDQSEMKPKGLPLMFAFTGKTDGDAKKCWPLDVAVLEDGTPVITDFHNKKIKAFDASGVVMGEVTVPSWPHGIVDVSSREMAVTLPEMSTIVFVVIQEESMRIRKRIRTAKQYRGISCDAISTPGNPSLVVSCCASGMQCIDVLTLDGVLIQTYRDDYRQRGRLLFTWPYYVTCNAKGEIIVSDCQTRNGVISLYRDGKVKIDEVLPEHVIKDPRGICNDQEGNILMADKTGNSIHCLDTQGKYKSVLVSQTDGLTHPIAVCLSPFGQLVVTQENGEIKVFKHN